MHLSLIILTPILICLWIYFLIIITGNLISSPTTTPNPNINNGNSEIEKLIEKEYFLSSNKTKLDAVVNKTKKGFHVPKFMLELYEKNQKEGKNLHKTDVVKSLIPSHAGKFVRQQFVTNFYFCCFFFFRIFHSYFSFFFSANFIKK